MASILARELLVVTGKGGTGKTTLSAALALLGAREGLQALIVEMGESGQTLDDLFGYSSSQAERPRGRTHTLANGLKRLSIEEDEALLEWMQELGGRTGGRMLASRTSFQYFAAAAPGARELVSMIKLWSLTESANPSPRGHRLVVLDAPATGHALGMLSSPETFARIARGSRIASQARQVRELLEDPQRSAYVAVARCTEMSIIETLELQSSLRDRLGRELEAVLVNGLLPRRFTGAELERISRLEHERPGNGDSALLRAAAGAARSVHIRSIAQRSHIARLQRSGLRVVRVPFFFQAQLDLAAVSRIAEHLQRGLLGTPS